MFFYFYCHNIYHFIRIKENMSFFKQNYKIVFILSENYVI